LTKRKTISVVVVVVRNRMHPEVAQASELGLQAYKSNDVLTAIAHVERALAIEPEHARLWSWLGEMYAEQEQFGASVTAFQKAIDLDDQLAGAHSGLGRSLQAIQKWSEAEAALRRSIDLRPTATRLVLLADIQASQGKEEDAERTLRQALVLEPTNDEALFNLGVRLSWKDPGEAEVFFRRAIEVDPKLAEAHRELGLLLARRGDSVRAEEMLRTSLDLDPEQPWALIYLGTLLSGEGRLHEAESAFLAASQQEPLWAEPHRLLGQLYLLEGTPAKAVEEYQRAVLTDPRDPDAALGFAKAHLALGRYTEGREWLETALRLGPPPDKVREIRELLGWQ
jgi:Tfp pilus assembly protein PilF